ncbi:MAG: CsbD family protein [Terriglobales bacterium]
MDKDTVKGKGKDIAGRVERQVGEWTGRKDLEAEGAAKQVEGKVQKGVGKVKEAGSDLADKMKDKGDKVRDDMRRDEMRKKDVA